MSICLSVCLSFSKAEQTHSCVLFFFRGRTHGRRRKSSGATREPPMRERGGRSCGTEHLRVGVDGREECSGALRSKRDDDDNNDHDHDQRAARREGMTKRKREKERSMMGQVRLVTSWMISAADPDKRARARNRRYADAYVSAGATRIHATGACPSRFRLPFRAHRCLSCGPQFLPSVPLSPSPPRPSAAFSSVLRRARSPRALARVVPLWISARNSCVRKIFPSCPARSSPVARANVKPMQAGKQRPIFVRAFLCQELRWKESQQREQKSGKSVHVEMRAKLRRGDDPRSSGQRLSTVAVNFR